jgi:hypothetical protein
MMHDYFEDFTTRFEFDCSVREKKSPSDAIDEIRNALDHFAKALVAASIFEGELPESALRPDHEPLAGDPRHLLDAWRGVRHIASGAYFSRHFAASCMAEEIGEILNTDLAKVSSQFDTFLQRFNSIERDFAKIEIPVDARFNMLKPLRQTIDDTWKLVFNLDVIILGLDELYRDIRSSDIDGVLL